VKRQRNLPHIHILMNTVSVAVITVDNTVKTNLLGFRDYILTLIFNDRPMNSFGVQEIDNKMFL
jgi:hypothetical protein